MAMRQTLQVFLVGCSLVICTTALVLPERAVVNTAGKKKWTTAAVATTLVATALALPHSAMAIDAQPSAFIVNIDSSTNPKDVVKSVFVHRNEIEKAVKDFVLSVKTISSDLNGVLPPGTVSIQLPSDKEAAAKDAASGIGRIDVNGSPIYIEVKSEEQILTVDVLVKSPFLPKIPFMAPTEETLKIPETFRIEHVDVDVVEVKDLGFWGNPLSIAGVKFTLRQSVQAISVGIPSIYAVAYGYYVWENEKEAKIASEKKKKVQSKKAVVEEKVPVKSNELNEETKQPQKVKATVATPIKDMVQVRKDEANTSTNKLQRLNGFLQRSEVTPSDQVTTLEQPKKDVVSSVNNKGERVTRLLSRLDSPTVTPVALIKDIGQVRKEVASTYAEKAIMMERLEKSKEVDSTEIESEPVVTVSAVVTKTKRFRLRRILKKIFMPWKK